MNATGTYPQERASSGGSALDRFRANQSARNDATTQAAAVQFSENRCCVAESDSDALPTDSSVLGLVEMILKNRPGLDRLVRQSDMQQQLVPRLLLISLCSFLLFGVALSITLEAAGVWPKLTALRDVFVAAESGRAIAFLEFAPSGGAGSHWLDGSALQLIAAWSLGLIAATGICLPSLYFYGLLAGVRMSMRDVVLHALKAKATGAIALIGILPVYAAVAIGVVILQGSPSTFGAHTLLESMLWLGLMLPFIGGLVGTWSMYHGFVGLADTIAIERRERRMCFMNRLALSWIAVYTAVSPVMIFTLWEFFSRS